MDLEIVYRFSSLRLKSSGEGPVTTVVNLEVP
jgi:hypothetical protein